MSGAAAEGELAPTLVLRTGYSWLDHVGIIGLEVGHRDDAPSALEAHANGKLDLAAFGSLPAGAVSDGFVSTGTGTGTCSRSVQVTSFGPGHQPKVIFNSAGDCRDAPSAPTATGLGRANQAVPPVTGRGTGAPEGKPLHTT